MADPIQQELRRAVELIKARQRPEAVQVLLPLLRADQQNVEAWWLLANAVDEARDKREALEKVLALRPDHDNARKMLDGLAADEVALPTVVEVTVAGAFEVDDPFADNPFDVEDDMAGDVTGEPQPFGGPPEPFGGHLSHEDAVALFSPLIEGYSTAHDAEAGLAGSSGGIPRSVGSPMGAAPKTRGGGTNPLVIVLAIIGAVAVCSCVACLVLAGSGLVAGVTLFGEVFEEIQGTLEIEGILLPSDADNRGSLTYGAAQPDTLQAGQRHAWTFTGSSGDPVVIDVSGDCTDPIVSLYGPPGLLVGSDDDGGQGVNAHLEYTLPTSGTYTIVVRSDSAGSYTLRLSVRR